VNAPAPAGSIIVVDDEEEIRILLYTLLEDAGYDVRLASSADQALAAMQERPARLLIIDYLMPEMNGLELLEATWAFTPRPRTIMLTGYASVDVALEAARLGIVQVLSKPFVAAELLDLVARSMAEAGAEQAPDVPDLWAESEQVLADARRILHSLKERLAEEPAEAATPASQPTATVANDTTALKGEQTIGYGPAGVVRLPRTVVIVDVIRLDDSRAAVGVFVDDGGKAVTLTLTSPYCPDGKDLTLRKVRDGISYTKVHPLSVHYGNFLHFKDDQGNILPELSCMLDLTKRAMDDLQDPYQLLGVERNSTIDEVRKAYLLLSARYHPDKAPKGMRVEASAAMCKVNESYARIRQDLRDLEAAFDPSAEVPSAD